jgi:hypothetical protein
MLKYICISPKYHFKKLKFKTNVADRTYTFMGIRDVYHPEILDIERV